MFVMFDQSSREILLLADGIYKIPIICEAPLRTITLPTSQMMKQAQKDIHMKNSELSLCAWMLGALLMTM